jgi:sugar phosphate permease
MEAKRSAAIASACVLLVVMLSGQVQQAAAISKFCACYQGCYPACRQHVPRFLCVPFCANKCSPSQAAATATGGGGGNSCLGACAAVKICGLSDPPAGKTTVHLTCIPFPCCFDTEGR